MNPETLEAIFVSRHQLVEDLIEAIRESSTTKNKHFRLLVGGWGLGKTHTVSLIYHRLSKMDDLNDKLLIAPLREEEWGISSFLDLLIRIFRALEIKYPEEYQAKLEQEIKLLYQMDSTAAEDKAAQLLREFVGKRTLLLLMENLDDIFNGLGDLGQKQFRAYLQNYSFINILATTQRLFNGVKQKNSPFYGFFYPQYLEQLELDEVVDLLKRIALLEGKKDLEDFIESPTGRDRISAFYYLAGGNHRIIVIFAKFLTRQSLDELVEPFMQTLDELTIYYQARMQWLSPQQRKIADFLGDRCHAVTVKEIAQHCFITHQTASSQLKELREKGYVKAKEIGRESFYELPDILVRMSGKLKNRQVNEISSIVKFWLNWFSQDDISLTALRSSQAPPTGGGVPTTNKFTIDEILEFSKDVSIGKSELANLLKVHQSLILAKELVKNIPALMSEMVSDRAAQIWIETWQELTSDCSEFQFPLRLLNSAVQYKQTLCDRRVLLKLPIEERNLLEPLLKPKQF